VEENTYQVMPALADEEYEALKADIGAHGVQVPIEMDDQGNILDGHHRVRAWQELRAEEVNVPDYPTIVRPGLDEAQKRQHARRLNLARRHLSSDQKRKLIKQQIEESPEMSDRQIAKLLGVSHPTVGTVRRELTGEVVNFTNTPIAIVETWLPKPGEMLETMCRFSNGGMLAGHIVPSIRSPGYFYVLAAHLGATDDNSWYEGSTRAIAAKGVPLAIDRFQLPTERSAWRRGKLDREVEALVRELQEQRLSWMGPAKACEVVAARQI